MGYRRPKQGLDSETLNNLASVAPTAEIRDSLELIRDYRRFASLKMRLATYAAAINPSDGRIHSSFDNRQSTGRISSSEPNLQQLAKVKTIRGITVVTRNLLVATPGYVLTAADTQQSDPRVLADVIARCPYSTNALVRMLQRQRAERLDLGQYQSTLDACRNPNFTGACQPLPPPFDPLAVHQLVEDFRNPHGDLYTTYGVSLAKQSRKAY